MARFEIHVPLVLSPAFPSLLNWRLRAIDDLSNANLILAADFDELHKSQLSVEVRNGLGEKAHNILMRYDPLPSYYSQWPEEQFVIIFRSDAKFPGSRKYFLPNLKVKKKMYTRDILEHAWKISTLDVAFEYVQNLIVATNVARPGSLMSSDSVGFFGRRLHRLYPGMVHILPEALERAIELGWPPLVEADISKTWKWYQSLSGPIQKSSTTPVARAVTAFTHTFDDNFSEKKIDNLIWNLSGLEALYTDGTPGVMHQLIEKSFVFLGKPENEKLIRKKIKQMYNFRSRSVHGQSNTTGKYTVDETEAFEGKEVEERAFADELAAIMLACSIQKCAIENRADLNFQYNLIN